MADPLCTTMGIFDISAGILIIVAFSNLLGVTFGLIMIGKGVMSFI